jgi:hypothetical protein
MGIFNKEDCENLTQCFNFNAVASDVANGFHFAVAVEAGGSTDYKNWADQNDKDRQQSVFATVDHASKDADLGMNIVLFKDVHAAHQFKKAAFGIPDFDVLHARIKDNSVKLQLAMKPF